MSTTINSIEITNLSYTELRTLMNNQPAKHLEEVPFGDYKLQLDLRHDVYVSAEETGYCKCYAAFVDGDYAGYMIIMASEMIHHKGTLQAITDSFYITPAYRSTGVFRALLSHVECSLIQNNIRFLTIGLNPNMPHYSKMDNMLNKLEYITTEVSVTKEL